MKKNKPREPEHIRPRLLLETGDSIQTGMLIDILGQSGIAAFAQGRDGGALDAYVGHSLYGDSIYVSEEDWERARDIIGKLAPGEEA